MKHNVMHRTAEDTQLFQTRRLSNRAYRSYTATGELYDAFILHKRPDGTKRLTDQMPDTAERRCQNPAPARDDRCWNGTDVIYAQPIKK